MHTLASGAVPIFSGGQDETLRVWSLPGANADPYLSVSTCESAVAGLLPPVAH